MKAIKIICAASVLAAGVANAATVATFDAGLSVSLSGPVTGSGSGAGFATLDDSGLLTITTTGDVTTSIAGTATLSQTSTFSGSYMNGIFTPSSGDISVTGCSPAAALTCVAFGALPTSPAAFDTVGGTVASNTGGTLNTTQSQFGATLSSVYTLTPTTPPVPLPPAAWLLGSALLAIAGTARTRLIN